MTFSMNKEASPRVLADPQFAIEWRDLVDFLSEFGPFNGRYVPRYPNNWMARLREHLADISLESLEPVKKQAILERIRRELPLCLEPVGWRYLDDQSWASNVSGALGSIEPAIVVGDALNPKPFVSWIDAIEDIRQSRKRSWHFHGTVSEYLDACRPLLLNSPSAYLIDCYLDPFSDVAENLIRSLFAAAKGSKCYSVELITRVSACGVHRKNNNSEKMSESEIELLFNRTYSDIIPKDRSLKLHLVTEGKLGGNALRLHDRFFLTMHGSIKFGQGFLMISQPVAQQNAFVVDKFHHEHLRKTFIDGVARFSEKLPKLSNIAYPHKVVSICVGT